MLLKGVEIAQAGRARQRRHQPNLVQRQHHLDPADRDRPGQAAVAHTIPIFGCAEIVGIIEAQLIEHRAGDIDRAIQTHALRCAAQNIEQLPALALLALVHQRRRRRQIDHRRPQQHAGARETIDVVEAHKSHVFPKSILYLTR